jgi:2-(1,2-epoxy-1,2-dihydrophenyl)acetyl-CoA isomerase
MQEYATITVEKIGHVGRVRLNRPDKMNSFDTTMRQEFVEAAREVNADPEIFVVLLGSHGRAFSAGADLSEENAFVNGEAVEDFLNLEYKPGILSIRQSRKPWIAVINGPCAGIGYSYAMACDLAVMADDAFLYQPFAAIGLVPDGGATWLLPQLVGARRAYELMMLGEKLVAEKALEWGMVNRVYPADSLQDDALAFATDFASRSPLAMRYTKEGLNFAANHSLEESISKEAALQKICIDSEDARNAVAAFMNKQQPEWKGR